MHIAYFVVFVNKNTSCIYNDIEGQQKVDGSHIVD